MKKTLREIIEERIKEIKKEMKAIRNYDGWDIEVSHLRADELLVELLALLGHGDIVDDYNEITKYYS